MDHFRRQMRAKAYASDAEVLHQLAALAPSPEARAEISRQASAMVARLRAEAKSSVMELFLAEYGLSSEEGVALMCLAEALLRVPDAATMDALIEDKIAPSEWGKHLGESHSTLVNASTWALWSRDRCSMRPRPAWPDFCAGQSNASASRSSAKLWRGSCAKWGNNLSLVKPSKRP